MSGPVLRRFVGGDSLRSSATHEKMKSVTSKQRLSPPRPFSKRPRPEGVALACPAKRGVGRREGPVGAVFVIRTPRGGGVRGESPAGACLGSMISRTTCFASHLDLPARGCTSASPTGLSPEEERIAFNSTPDRQSLLGSHGQRPWVYLVLNQDAPSVLTGGSAPDRRSGLGS